MSTSPIRSRRTSQSGQALPIPPSPLRGPVRTPRDSPRRATSKPTRSTAFEATEYALRTDQLGTQLDPPAHWAPEYPAIDELPATYAIRPLVVISIVDQVKTNPNYTLQVADIKAWEEKRGRIPEGSVVFVRSDWSKAWP